MKSITKRIISTLAICGALVLEAGAVAFKSFGTKAIETKAADSSVTYTLTDKNWGTTVNPTTETITWTNGGSFTEFQAYGSCVDGKKEAIGSSSGMFYNVKSITMVGGLGKTAAGEWTVKYKATADGTYSDVGSYSESGTGTKHANNFTIAFYPALSGYFQISVKSTSDKSSQWVYLKSFTLNMSEPTTKYDVTYMSNGTGEDPVTNNTDVFEECMFTAPTGKKFDSWNTSSLGSGTKYEPDDTVPSKVTVYAIWKDVPLQKEYTLVTDAGDLEAGDEILLACNSKKVVAGGFNTKYLESTAGTFSNDLSSVTSENGVPLTLGGDSKGWTLTNKDGQIGRNGGDLAIGSSDWFITIASNGTATIGDKASSPSNVMKYNSSSPRFKTYASGQTDVQIYKAGSSEPKLSAPTNLKYENGALSWTGVANATGYKVSVNDGAATTVTNTSYTVALPQLASVSVTATDSSSTYKDSSAATYLYKNPGSSTNPLSVSDAVKLIEYETGKVNGQYTDEKIYVTGVTTADSTYSSTYSNYDKVIISDVEKTLTIQRATRSDGNTDTIKAGSTVVGYGYGEYYNGCTLYPKSSENPVLTSVIGQTYTVSYKPGAYGTGSEQSDVKQEGVALTLKGAIFTRTGYTQTGWSTSDGGAKVYELNGSYTADAAATLYPYWEAETYTVSYNKGSYGTGENTSDTKTYNVALTLKGVSFTRKGYTQTGWSTAADGSTKAYELGGSYTDNVATTLYPYWSQKASHSVTYNLNGGSGTAPTQADVVEDLTFTVASATGITKEHYTFAGWSDGSTTYAAGSTYTMGTSNVTLTAQWELDKVSYSVAYSLTGVTVPGDAPTSVEEGDDLVVAVTPNQHYKIETMGVTMGDETAEYTYENGVLTVENVTGNIVVSVNAAEKWYGATTSSSQNVTFGSIDAHLYHNEPLDVDVTANTGCHIVDEYSSVAMWKDEGGFEDIPDAYSNGHIHVDHVTGNLVLQIIAVKDTFSVSATLNDSVVAEGSELPETVEYGDNLNVTFEPKTGYQINSITYKVGEAAEQTVTGSTLSIENITANVSLTVNTQKIVYSVTATYGDSTNSNTTTSIEYGDSYSGKITPNDGKKFTSISMTMGGNPVTVAEDGTYNIASVTGNIVINVVTTDITYEVSATGSHYTNSNTATSVLWHGAYEATITPDDGYFIEDLDVTMGGEPVTVSITEHGTSATISIASVTGDIDIDVTSTEIEMTSIASASAKAADYEFGYNFGVNDVTVVANYNDGTTGSVDATSVEGYDITKSGSQTVTVKVGEFEKEITVVIRQSTVIDSIEASTEKTEVEYGGTFTVDDVSVTYIYTDGHTLPDQAADSITGFDPNKVGAQTVTVTAEGKEDTITVTVLPSTVIDHISASTDKSVLDYGSSFTKEDVKVTYHYTDGHTLPDQAAEEISEFNPTLIGEQEITVTAAGKTTTITVTVNDRVVTSLDVTGYDQYVDQGKEYVFKGTVTAHYADGGVEDVTSKVEISKVDTSGHGPQSFNVSYKGVSVEVAVNVIQTKTPVEAYQAVAIAGGAVIAVSAIAVGIFFFLKKFKI